MFTRKALLGACLALVGLMPLKSQAEIRTQPVEYRDGKQILEGYLAYDDATESVRPGVLVIPEWWGLTDYPKRRATMLAKQGYVAFVADMYGKGQVTNDPKQAAAWATPLRSDRALMRERAGAGLDVLLANKLTDKTKVAAIGYCFGGTTALELARGGAPLAGVISFHGDLSRTENEGPDNIKCKILVCHGADDPMVTPASVMTFVDEMKLAKADYQINVYANAVHAFTNPEADGHHIPGIGYSESADKRSWMALNDFFSEVFGAEQVTKMPAEKM